MLWSCADFPLDTGKVFESGSSSETRRAEKLLNAGKYQEAAAIFWAEAETRSSPQKQALQIRAAEAVLQPETKLQAQQYLSAIDESILSSDLLVRKRVASAELALLNGQAQVALDTAPEKLINVSEKYNPHLLAVRAKALKSAGEMKRSIETRITLNQLLRKPNQLKKNNELIWQTLLNTNNAELNSWSANNNNPELAAWLSLVAIQKRPHENQPSLDSEIQQWRANYPQHRIPNHIINSITSDYASFHIAPNKIALLLPLTGRYSKVAEAVYAGITTAREFGEAFNPAPELVVYDTGDNPSSALSYYQRAISEGADFIIGPFQKDTVRTLANQGTLPVPTLSLNYSDNGLNGTQNLYQFGLLPEDEAKQVAERAAFENKGAALVLVPEGEWGMRLLSAFTQRFHELGGSVIQAERYLPQNSDYSVAIKSLLQLNQSEQRKRTVQSIVKAEVEFEPRRRQDADFIFIAASPQQARLIRPQLSFHFASDLPVYATSHVFSGNENISADQDINGIRYCDMPWLLSSDPSVELLRDSLDLQSASSSARLPRFAALGIDAYQIIPHLQRLAANNFDRYQGTTGKLSVDTHNRIYRELVWAEFKKGRPESLGATPDYSTELITN
ncbi:MAG: penicillin-binding protein activator [Gammaproteobacteria bacterium]